MIYAVSGFLSAKKDTFIVVDVAGIGFRVFLSERNRKSLPQVGEKVNFFCFSHVRQDGIDLYGFQGEQELTLFELLNSVSGVGPKSALSLFAIASVDEIVAAIGEGKPELLSQSTGIGKKIAGRIVLELRGKLEGLGSAGIVETMEKHADVERALVGLGYAQRDVREALYSLQPGIETIEDKIKESLKYLKNK